MDIEVSIQADRTLGYGFSIMGGDKKVEGHGGEGEVFTPIFISKINPEAPAGLTGKMVLGARLKEINSVNIEGKSHSDVIAELKKAKGTITLKLESPRAQKNVYVAQVEYEKVRILFPFNSGEDDELSLVKGEVVYVMGKGEDGWCYGVSQRSGKGGMFPGRFAIKLNTQPAVLDSIYSSLEQMQPGITDRSGELLYEEVSPLDSSAGASLLQRNGSTSGSVKQRRSQDGAYATVDAMRAFLDQAATAAASSGGSATSSSMKRTDAVGRERSDTMADLAFLLDDNDVGGADESVYPLASADTPKVTLVGKATAIGSGDDSDSILYASLGSPAAFDALKQAPGEEDAAGEVVYDTTGGDNHGLLPNVAIEDLYATVNKPGGNVSSGGVQTKIVADDVYATLDDLRAYAEAGPSAAIPQIPDRKYTKSLLPPTVHVQLGSSVYDEAQDDDNGAYELLPWQKEGQMELDVDSVAVMRRVSQQKFSPEDLPSGDVPALPPRKLSAVVQAGGEDAARDSGGALDKKVSKAKQKKITRITKRKEKLAQKAQVKADKAEQNAKIKREKTERKARKAEIKAAKTELKRQNKLEKDQKKKAVSKFSAIDE